MTSDRELILSAVARRTDPDAEHQITPEPASVAGIAPRLVLDPTRIYDLQLRFWLHVIVPESQVASAAPFYEVAGTRSIGPWVEIDRTDDAPGRGHIRGESIFADVTGVAGPVTAGLLIQGSGGYTVGHLAATAADPYYRAADAACRAVASAAHAASFAGATDDPGAIVLIAGIAS